MGIARAYEWRPWTYWFSPLLDLPVALRLITSALRRRQVWRGRVYVRRAGGTSEPLDKSETVTNGQGFGLATFVSMTLFDRMAGQTDAARRPGTRCRACRNGRH